MSSGTKTGPAGGTGPATDTGGDAVPATGDRTGTDVPGGVRERIDELDRRIIALVQERRAASADARRTRADAGAGHAEAAPQPEGEGGLAREMEILKRYRRELGRPGTQLAMTLLSLSRG
ncbi:chorismate mutase [Streptomyces ovatisporus]|uniref:Chorismate mutase n=1 Tax=Streptomyces ovatisporus TaxID=1128682 RepID=A0ABV9A0C6_9ACTN